MISSAVQSMMSTYRWASKLMAGSAKLSRAPGRRGRPPARASGLRPPPRGTGQCFSHCGSAAVGQGAGGAADRGPFGWSSRGMSPVLVPGALSEEEEEEDLTAAAAAPARSRVPVPAACRLRGRTWTPPAGS